MNCTANQNGTKFNSTVPQLYLRPARVHPLVRITLNWLETVQQWLDAIEIRHRNLAWFLFRVIPAQCPFERDIILFGHKVTHIPPLCKLNPFYDQLVGLRFRALCYLVDRCGESI